MTYQSSSRGRRTTTDRISFPKKVIPLFVTNAIDDIPVPLYGDGKNVRDWLHVNDHCQAVDLLIDKATAGEVYNIGGGNEVMNVDLTKQILSNLGKPGVAHQPGSRSTRSRSPLLPGYSEAARPGVDAASAL